MITVVVVVMVVVVIPSFSKMFADMDTGLPGITKALLALSDFIRGYWYIIIAVIAAITIGIKTFKKTKTGIYFFANLGVKMPAFGNLTVIRIFPFGIFVIVFEICLIIKFAHFVMVFVGHFIKPYIF